MDIIISYFVQLYAIKKNAFLYTVVQVQHSYIIGAKAPLGPAASEGLYSYVCM